MPKYTSFLQEILDKSIGKTLGNAFITGTDSREGEKILTSPL